MDQVQRRAARLLQGHLRRGRLGRPHPRVADGAPDALPGRQGFTPRRCLHAGQVRIHSLPLTLPLPCPTLRYPSVSEWFCGDSDDFSFLS